MAEKSNTLPLPQEVSVEETLDGVRYGLPVRTLGGGHVFGAAIIAAGMVLAFAGMWMGVARLPTPGGGGGPNGFITFANLIFPITLVLMGTVFWTLGMFIAKGRTDLELRGGKLVRIERAGLLRWSISTPINHLVGLRIELGLTQDRTINEAIAPGLSINTHILSALVGEYSNGTTARLLVGYSSAWLEALATDLSYRIAQHPARSDSDKPEVVIHDPVRQQGAAGGAATTDVEDPISLPSESPIEMKRTAEGLTITLGPTGKSALSFGAAWNGAMAMVTGGMFGFMNMPWHINLVVAIIWLISILITLLALTIGRRGAIVDVVSGRPTLQSFGGQAGGDDTLLITQHHWMGVRQRQWRRDELEAIECGASGMEVNEKPLMQLQISPRSGGTESFFTGRDEQELRWLARTLRETLRVPRHSRKGA